MANTVTVKGGDTLSALGQKLGVPWKSLYEANKGIVGPNPNVIKPGQVLTVPGVQAQTTPVTPAQEQPAGDISGTLPRKEQPASPLGNLQTALRTALEEAGRQRAADRFQQLAPEMGQVIPGNLGAIAGIIKGSVGPDVTSIFGDVLEERKAEAQQREFALRYLDTIIDNRSIAEMPEAAILSFEQQAGLPEGSLLATKVRVRDALKLDEQKQKLELNNIRSLIASRSAQETRIVKLERRTDEVNDFLEQAKTSTGFVSSTAYQQALQKWIAKGGTRANFFASFPQQGYLQPEDIQALPPDLQPVQVVPQAKLNEQQLATLRDAKAALDRAKLMYQDVPALRAQIIQRALQEDGFDLSPYL